MADNESKSACSKCFKEYPADTTTCPLDGGKVAATAADPLLNTLFAEKYEIISLLGEGGMSRVYKARHTFMERIVAVKLLHESATSDVTAKARFQQEAKAASALSHHNVVTVYDFGLTPGGRAFIIMDCLEGDSLSDILEHSGSLQVEGALEIFTQGCEGLEHAHRKGIIHRDLKPSNLVIIKQDDGTDLVKLVDFGIAKLVHPAETGKKDQHLTQTGQIFGTPAYMSPEQCNGRTLDVRSDIYSFGCLMYEALAGTPPLIGDSYIATVVKHVSEAPKPLSETALVKVPHHLETVIMKCLEKDPGSRFGSAAELKQALLDAAFASGLKGLRVGAVPEPKPLGTSQSGPAIIKQDTLVRESISRTNRWKNIAVLTVCTLGAFAGTWFLFLYPGPADDRGTFFTKLRWQTQLSAGSDLMRDHKYPEAAKTLEENRLLANTFDDDDRRLETVLNKLVECYTLNHDSAKLEQINNEVVQIANKKVYTEFESLLELMKQWATRTNSYVMNEEHARQAAAFGDRIGRCADKLSVRSREKQEFILKRAIAVYDALGLRDGIFRTRFRLQLAEIYRAQQRFEEQRNVIIAAVAHAAVSPLTPSGWRLKIQSDLLLGELNRNDGKFDLAKEQVDNALELTRRELPTDKELLRDCLNAASHVYNAFHTKEFKEKAKVLRAEAKGLEDKLDADSSKL